MNDEDPALRQAKEAQQLLQGPALLKMRKSFVHLSLDEVKQLVRQFLFEGCHQSNERTYQAASALVELGWRYYELGQEAQMALQREKDREKT